MKVQIKKLSQGLSNICLFSKEVFESLNLSKSESYNIHLGQNSYSYSVGVYEDSENTMAIPTNIFYEFLIFEDMNLNIRKENKEIYIGPVVGIFINHCNFIFYEDGTAPRYHGRAALSESCIFYYFSFNDIDWINKRIKGYTLVPDSEKWVHGWFPMPDVIYDRGIGFSQEEKPIVKETRKKFKNHPIIKIINNRNYLGKKETYEKLSRFPEVCRFLPRTVTYTNPNDLIMMLKRNDFIFLKASFGSGGKKVVSIEKVEDNYKLVFYSGGLKEIEMNDIQEVKDYVEKYTEGHQYILQEGIRLLKYKGSFFDMRLLIIKDNDGKWRVMSNQARIAKGDFTITNYCTGGSLKLYEKIYPDLESNLCSGKIPDNEEVESATLMLAEYIEKAFGSFGELGMDMAIDVHGKIWFIEANTKPDKDLALGIDDFEGINLFNLAVFQYAKFLSHFKEGL